VDVRDLLLLQQIIFEMKTATVDQLIRGDVAPLSGGVPAPDGALDVADYIVLARKVTGSISF